jgi:hypothetical protein
MKRKVREVSMIKGLEGKGEGNDKPAPPFLLFRKSLLQ